MRDKGINGDARDGIMIPSHAGIIILAAGNSSRLGRPKQLLEYRGSTFIKHLVDEAVVAELEPIVVVCGAVDLRAELGSRPVTIVDNLRWQDGMASSIAAGAAFISGKAVDSVMIAVCDQPYVTAALFAEMIATRARSGRGIIACAYAGTIGNPVLFDRRYVEILQELTGQEGAKKILHAHSSDVAIVPFPEGVTDIDTEDDFARLPAG